MADSNTRLHLLLNDRSARVNANRTALLGDS